MNNQCNEIKESDMKKIRILIVDDAYPMRMIISKMLSTMGFKSIDEAADGKQALKMAIEKFGEGKRYDLIISDWNMPVESGLTLLKNIRSTKHISTTPFLLLTAESEEAKIVLAVEHGVSHYSTKPFSYQMLAEAVEKTLSSPINV